MSTDDRLQTLRVYVANHYVLQSHVMTPNEQWNEQLITATRIRRLLFVKLLNVMLQKVAHLAVWSNHEIIFVIMIAAKYSYSLVHMCTSGGIATDLYSYYAHL